MVNMYECSTQTDDISDKILYLEQMLNIRFSRAKTHQPNSICQNNTAHGEKVVMFLSVVLNKDNKLFFANDKDIKWFSNVHEEQIPHLVNIFHIVDS